MAFRTEAFTVEYGEKKISAALTMAVGGASDVCIVLAHGAGGDMNSKQLLLLAEAIVDKGISVLRFTCKGLNIKYRTKVYARVVNFILSSSFGINKCFLAGRSMGSRAAVNVANENLIDMDDSVLGVICLSYPLYPPKSPDKMRDSPLYDLKHSCLFISGENDDMCSRDRMERVLKQTHSVDMNWIQNAGHDLIDKSIGLEETVKLVADKIVQWCSMFCSAIVLSVPPVKLPTSDAKQSREQLKEGKTEVLMRRSCLDVVKPKASIKRKRVT